jgi:glycine/D-amino acid oxidase-like deaminating enzyme
MPRTSAPARRNGDLSFWQASLGAVTRRPPLAGDREADVCIVGGGFTGLWTAYHLKRARPELDVVVLEREHAGFGASGRNGGSLMPAFGAHGGTVDPAIERALRDSVADIEAVCTEEGIDCDWHAGGVLRVARGPAQAARLRAAIAEEQALGVEDLHPLDAGQVAERIRIAGASAGLWTPNGVRVQPAKLVRGLATAAERRGATICESSAVRELRPAGADGRAVAVGERGTVRAPTVLCCLEGFTHGLLDQRRVLLPLNSAMLVTAPLPESTWAQIGWDRQELLGDNAHAYFYAQRTADGRIALGGRGVPYRYGSRTDRDGRTQRRTIAGLVRVLHTLFPSTVGAPIDHAWCGVLGVARDWQPAVRLDRTTGIGIAGGYVGLGIGASNLAGRTLRDLVLGEDSELTRLAWVGHRARRWEPEPLRFIGANLVYALYRAADRREAASGAARTSPLAHAADWLAGR